MCRILDKRGGGYIDFTLDAGHGQHFGCNADWRCNYGAKKAHVPSDKSPKRMAPGYLQINA